MGELRNRHININNHTADTDSELDLLCKKQNLKFHQTVRCDDRNIKFYVKDKPKSSFKKSKSFN